MHLAVNMGTVYRNSLSTLHINAITKSLLVKNYFTSLTQKINSAGGLGFKKKITWVRCESGCSSSSKVMNTTKFVTAYLETLPKITTDYIFLTEAFF